MNALVRREDLEQALRSHLDTAQVPGFEFETSQGTEKVQGFISLVLRVVVTLDDGRVVNFIAKRQPVSELQLKYTRDSDFHTRECEFFNKAQPILDKNFKEKGLVSPIVRCHLATPEVVLLEDLSVTGHRIVSNPLTSINYCSLDLACVELTIRKLAGLHTASVGVDWLGVLPHLARDGLFDDHGRSLMEPRITNGSQFVSEVLKMEFPELGNAPCDWITSDRCYQTVIDSVGTSQIWPNVLNHGDIWENNTMFQFDKNGKPCGLSLIDLQLVRYSPASTDLHFFLYLCTDAPFRAAHESDLLATYVSEFNAALAPGVEKLAEADFRAEYDHFRLLGSLLAATIRPACFIEGVVAENDGEINQGVISAFIEGLPVEALMQRYKEDECFKRAVLLLVKELVNEMKRHKII